MSIIFVLLAGIVDPLAMASGMDAIPVEQQMLTSSDLPVPVSDSVRAATWDDLTAKPLEPVHVKVACIVAFGASGSCVQASDVASDSKTIDWAKARDDNDRWVLTAKPADVALLQIAAERLQTARTQKESTSKSIFVIRFFDEVISPNDARPPFVPKETLAMSDVALAKPIDTNLIGRLYPVMAIRNATIARVTMACDIQNNLKLLCRDHGTVAFGPIDETQKDRLARDFRFSTYQFASTLQLMPKDKNGNDVIGRQLKFSVAWRLPDR